MKKFYVYVVLLIIMLPLNVFAYSNYVYVGGDTIGINIKYNGLVVTGFYKVNNKYNSNKLKVGDRLIKVNDSLITGIDQFSKLVIKEKDDNNNFILTYVRDGKEYKTSFKVLEDDNGVYKTGLYVKDSIKGIGTLTYVDPSTNIYGALGHEIVDNTNNSVEVKSGSIFENKISSIDKSVNGYPGTKNARFYYDNVYGDIDKNNSYGIFGDYTESRESNLFEVGNPKDIKVGKAYLKTVLDNETIKLYEIKILKINNNSKLKNLYFEIVDPSLLEECGGIVQGMSGSPIIQDNKIIGAVTHVVVDNVKRGYGIFITKMLEEGEK